MNWETASSMLERGLLIATLAAPFLAALGLLMPQSRCQGLALRLAPWTPLPALACVVWGAGSNIELPWLLLGVRFGLDETGRVFLGFTASLWFAAGIYGLGYFDRESDARAFFFYFLLSMAGNFGLVLALDGISFFMFFTLMSFAAYGLIVHERTPESLRAARIYMLLVILGEFLLFTALVGLSVGGAPVRLPVAGGQNPDAWVVALLIVGFGIKAGALPLHVWLPLAHPAAPTPASAVLSGAMIKAGLLGWLRFLPLGTIALPHWGAALVTVGVLAAFYGVLVGVVQRSPKTVLAYSSISQMGYMTVAVGAGLTAPLAWPAILAATLVYAVHHAFAKGALFLGVGAAASGANRTAVMLVLAVPAFALAGAPFSSGAVAKLILKTSIGDAPVPSAQLLVALLSVAAAGTAILMVRFLLVVGATGGKRHRLAAGGWLAWGATLIGVLAAVYLLPEAEIAATRAWSVERLPGLVWPLALGVTIALTVWRFSPPLETLPAAFRIPAGDLLVAVADLTRRFRQSSAAVAGRGTSTSMPRADVGAGRELGALLVSAESALRSWLWVGVSFLLLVLVLAAILAFA